MDYDFETDPTLTERDKSCLRGKKWEMENPEAHKRSLERLEKIREEYNMYGGPDYL